MKQILPMFILLVTLVGSVNALADQNETCATAACGDTLSNLRSSLKTQGTAQFTWWTFDVYRAHLYIPGNTSDTNVVSIRPKILEITYDREFTRDDFVTSGEEILKDNPEVDVNSPAIRQCLDEMARLYRPVAEGDTYSIVHTAAGPLELWLNDKALGSACTETGTRAYFSIWLSAKHSIKDGFQKKLVGDKASTTRFIAAGGDNDS